LACAGDPGNENAVGVVDEVVSGKGVHEVKLASQVSGCDGDELTVARGFGPVPSAKQEAVSVRSEERSRNEDQRVIARARRVHDCLDRRGVANYELVDQRFRSSRRHGATVP
jgi:hypothetical protein